MGQLPYSLLLFVCFSIFALPNHNHAIWIFYVDWSVTKTNCGGDNDINDHDDGDNDDGDHDDGDHDDGDHDDGDNDDGDDDCGDDDPTRSPVGKLCLPSDNLKVENF